MELFKRGDVYWVDAMIDGKRIRVSTRQRKKGSALEAALRILENGGEKKKVCPTLKGFVSENFLPYLEAHSDLAPKTKDGYRYGWSLLSGQPIANMQLDQIRLPHLDTIQVQGSPSTHNCAMRTLSRVLHHAVRLDVISVAPKVPLREEKERTRLQPGVEDKVAAALATSRRRGALGTALYVILDSGMRPMEISRMRIEDLNFLSGLIHVPDSKTRAGVRYVPMTMRLRGKLLEQIAKRTDGWVFPSPRYPGQPIQRQALTVAWRKAANKAGVAADVNLYCARHSFGSDVMEATKNQFKLMKVMGHTTVKTTQRYQHHETADIGTMLEDLRLRHNLRHSGQEALEIVS
jgi:integrase